MPRKLRAAKARRAPLSPALAYRLMTGSWAEARIDGWVAAAMLWRDEASHLQAAWEAHGEALTVEADAAGFVPFMASRKRPSGPGFDSWADRFLSEHRY
jgi:hypothetical protein